MNLQLNYHHLRYFLAVATEGGITAAASVLHVSPPTLSAQVRELEGSLGVELFRRQGKAMVLTDAGRVVKRYAERIFAFGDEMAEVVRRGGAGEPETISAMRKGGFLREVIRRVAVSEPLEIER